MDPSFIQNIIHNAMARGRVTAEAEEKKRRSMPEWAKYYEFQSWLENVNIRAGEQGEQQMEDSNMHKSDGNVMAIDEGQSGEDMEEEMDMKMPAADANVEPLNKKAKRESSDEQTDEERDEYDQFDINLDNLHKDDNLQRQLDILGPYLFNKKGIVHSGYPISFFWRALWSVEEHHDVHFMAYRLRHFDRWDREHVSVDDPWRWKTFGAGDKVLYFPGKFASHDAKCAWAGLVVEESQGNELRPSFDTTWPRDMGIPSLGEVGDIISDILLACSPEKLQVCLYIDRTMIDSFLTLAVVQEEEEEESITFSSGQIDEEFEANSRKLETRKKQPGLSSVSKFLSSPYLRKDSTIEITDQMSEEALGEKLDVFKKWLENDSPAFGTLHKEPILVKLPPKRFNMLTSGMMNRRSLLGEKSKDDLVLLATCPNVSKDSDTNKVLDEMIEKLGLNSEIVGIQATSSRNKEIHSYAYLGASKIGGNIHYPDFSVPLDDATDDDASKSACVTSVSFTWTSTERLTQDHIKRQQYKQAFKTEFVKRAEARKKVSGGRLTFILWPRERSEEEDGYFSRQQPIPITNENSHIIWLPGDYESMEEKAFDMFLGGGGGGGLRFNRTNDGNLFWQSVMSYFDHHVVYGKDACLLYDDSYEDGDEREYTTIPNEHSLKMLHLLIITRAFVMADGEMFDHEYPEEEIKTFFDKFCEEWRRVLSQSDDTLGLGLTEAFNYARQTLVSAATAISAHSSGALNDLLYFQALFEGCYQENTPVASREGLDALLGFHGTWLEEKNWEEEDFDISLVPNEEEEDDTREEDEENEDEMEEDDL